MALIVFKNNERKFVSPEEGRKLWLIKNGELKGSAAERAKANRIEKFYLNRNNAPVSYLVTVPDPTAVARPVPYARLPYVDKD